MPVLKNCIHTVSKNMQKKDRQFSFNFDFAIRPNRTDKHIPDRKMFLHVVQMLRLLCLILMCVCVFSPGTWMLGSDLNAVGDMRETETGG